MEISANAPTATSAPDSTVLAEMKGESTGVALRSNMSIGALGGEIDASEIRIPYLSVAYGVGGLAAKFNPGDLVLAKEHLLATRGQPLEIVILSGVKYWKEWVGNEAYQSGHRANRFLTKEEVKNAGGTTDWGPNNEKPSYGPAMDLLFLIRKPDALVCSLFGVELNDKQSYALAKLTADKGNYKRVGRPIIDSLALSLRNKGLAAARWELKTEMVQGRMSVQPALTLRMTGINSTEIVAELTEKFGALVSGKARAVSPEDELVAEETPF